MWRPGPARALLVAVLAAGLATSPPAPAAASPAPSTAYPSASVALEGHGNGHGLGMGAWGAHGMAVRNPGKPGEEIAAHYFPGAAVGGVVNEQLRAWLDFDTPLVDTIVTAGDPPPVAPRTVTPFTVWDLSSGTQVGTSDAAWPFWRAVRAEGGLQVQRAPDSGGGPAGWTAPDQQVGDPTPGPVEFRPPPGPQPSPSAMLQVQFSTTPTWRYLRGSVRSAVVGVDVYTVNVLPLEEYLYGVLRIEGSPPRWDGPGREGLRALAIVARSYTLHKRRLAEGSPYDICSTSNCQNYRGWGFVDAGGATVQLEDPRTNAAVDTTAGGALLHGDPPVPVLGAYSSSSGGYTKPDPRYPYLAPVPDPDDDIEGNPSHLWRATIPVATMEAAWPQAGALQAFDVIGRNGYGDWGGRVTAVRIRGSDGTVTATGNEVRAKLGLRSDWFRVLLPGGYWVTGEDGGIFAFGGAPFHGSTGGTRLNHPIAGIAAAPGRDGYWLVAADGGIFAFGDAPFHGSTGGIRLNRPVIGIAGAPEGYWLAATDGGIFSFGEAGFHGSTGGIRLNRAVVAVAPTPTGQGYWLAAADGGVFSFGDAAFFGSTGGQRLNQPIVAMAASPTGQGYWLAAADGGVFAFGDAAFFGSTGGQRLNQPIVTMAAGPTGGGYYLLGRDGGVFAFGDAAFFGSVPGVAPASNTAKVGIALASR